jgi:3-carboxy-cis,cis-muconate cycloisomerase
MAGNIDDGLGLIYAEALSFALAQTLPRPEAQAAVKALCAEVRASGTPLGTLAAAKWPKVAPAKLFTPQAQLGLAPADARAFAKAALAY